MNDKKPKRKIDLFWVKAGFFILISILCLYGVFRISSQFQLTAQEVNKLRAQAVASQIGDQTQTLEIELGNNQEDVDLIQGYFPTEGEILELLVQLDNLKRAGVITDFLITSDNAVKDSLGLYGLPLSVTVNGDQAVVNNAFEALSNLPFLSRPIVLSIERLEDGALVTNLGSFIYVDEEFNQDR